MTSPQFGRRTHRAREHLLALARQVPDLWSLVDQVRAIHAADVGGPDWPRHTYLPLEQAGGIAAAITRQGGEQPTPAGLAHLATDIATLAAWRMTQGIYRYDPALYAALVDTPIAGDLPVSVLQRLPEWCVYLETPGMTVSTTAGETPLHGAYAWLDHAQGADHDILTLLLDAEGTRLTPTHVPLIGTLEQALDALLAEWRDGYQRGNAARLPRLDWAEQAGRTLPPILSLLLYLCSEAPDLTRRGQVATPGNPQPVRTRRHGWRLFAADGPAEWDVGVRIGAALRCAYQREQIGQRGAQDGHRVRPHVRRAHWHTILSGPRLRPDGAAVDPAARRRDLRWMPPIPVNVADLDALPAVVRPVR